jgi:pilus assembly protein CpaD
MLIMLPLAGCGGDRVVADSTTPPDYHARHPIVIAEAEYTLDVFPTGAPGGLDPRSADRLRDFARRYGDFGHGQITVLVPRGGANDFTVNASLAHVRELFSSVGARGALAVSSYPVADSGLASPMRLSFEGLKAHVPHRCGDWPNDLASGSTTNGWENKTYWNFGCANQNALAVQVADPRDLAGPRGERPADTSMRVRAIENVRKGTDPGTKWDVKNSGIGAVGASSQ